MGHMWVLSMHTRHIVVVILKGCFGSLYLGLLNKATSYVATAVRCQEIVVALGRQWVIVLA